MAMVADYLPSAYVAPRVSISVDEAAAWYEARAPELLPVGPPQTRDAPAPLRFRRRFVLMGPESGPGVATVSRLAGRLETGAGPLLAAPNMATGSIHLFTLRGGPRRVGAASHPARVSAGDLDGDGLEDLLVADLGHPLPTDDRTGRVLLGRNRGGGRFELETILDDVGRVADAKPLDLDGDGDLDVVVAAFGWLRSGGIHVLHNETRAPGAPTFRSERVNQRSGAVSVVPTRELWPGAGAGFVVAFSQHYEQISAFHPARDGRGGFDERVLYRAPHCNFGTSNIEPTDLDGDGDTDFLLAHGDTLDDGVAFKPYHGVEWLENRGDGSFALHHIGALFGAHGAVAADLDGDGDLDVVAAGFLPQVEVPVPKGRGRVDSLVWFERSDEGWIPWSIEANHPRHTGLTVVDADLDGRLDVVTTINRAWDIQVRETGPSLEIFFNEGAR
jgi:hypothetical protein